MPSLLRDGRKANLHVSGDASHLLQLRAQDEDEQLVRGEEVPPVPCRVPGPEQETQVCGEDSGGS